MSSRKRNVKYYGASEPTIWPADHQTDHKPKAKKDTKRWCLGKVGREHVPILQLNAYGGTVCHVAPSWWRSIKKGKGQDWACFHRLVCDICGKVIEPYIPSVQCPANPNRVDA